MREASAAPDLPLYYTCIARAGSMMSILHLACCRYPVRDRFCRVPVVWRMETIGESQSSRPSRSKFTMHAKILKLTSVLGSNHDVMTDLVLHWSGPRCMLGLSSLLHVCDHSLLCRCSEFKSPMIEAMNNARIGR